MKKVLFSLALLLSVSTVSVSAQRSGQRGGKNKELRNDKSFHAKELNLSEDQKAQAEKLNQDFKTKMDELRESREASLMAILTPEQKEKAEKLFKDRPQDRPQDRSNKGGKNQGKPNKERKNEYSKLSDESKSKIKVLKDNYEKEKKAVEMSRIAPEEQKRKLTELETKFKADRKAIIQSEKVVK